MLRYFGRILAMEPTRLPRQVYELLRAEGCRRSWTGVVERLTREWDLVDTWESQRLPPSQANDDDGDAWRESLRARAKLMALAAHRDEIAASASTIARNYASWHHVADDDTQMRMADYVSLAGAEDASVPAMFALRSGTSSLRVDCDRWLRVPHADRVCRLCERGPEDAHHVLVECPAHEDARRVLVSKLPWYLRNLRAPHVFNGLMGSADLAAVCGDDDAAERRSAVCAVNAFFANVQRRRGAPEWQPDVPSE